MKKVIIILLFMFALVISNASATLMYSEDFESYDLNNVTWHSVDNKWFCPDLDNNDCKETDWGVPPATANATQFISQDIYGNQYLLLWSWDANNNGGKKVQVNSNITSSGWVYQNDWSVQFDINYVWSDWTSISGFPNAQRNAIGGLKLNNFGSYTDGDVPISAVGGRYNGTIQDDFELLRIKWQGLPFDAEPQNSICDVKDGAWHRVTQHYVYDSSTLQYNMTDVYVDLSKCITYTGTKINPNTATSRLFSAISSDGHLVYVDNIKIYMGELVTPSTTTSGTCNTSCDSWFLPYYLTEGFVGQLYICDWLNNYNSDCMLGELSIPSNYTNYYAQKDMDLVLDDYTRYATVQFNLDIESMPQIASTFAMRLYDSDEFNFITIYSTNSTPELYYDDDSTSTKADDINLAEEFAYKFVIDLVDDTYDIYFNGSLSVSDAGFTDAFANIEDIQTIKFVSSYTAFTLDDLYVFASDSSGNPQMPDEELEVEQNVSREIKYCGLLWENPPSCSSDDDCDTGKCMVNGRCSSFDFTYCDDNGKPRDKMCMISGFAGCVLSETGDAILDNFFLFLILLVLVMGAVYLAMMLRR